MTVVGNLGAANLPYRTATGTITSGATSTGGKLWLPIWSGEIIHAYDEYNQFESLVNFKTISSGTEILFPKTGTVTLKAEWDAGEELVGNQASTSDTFKITLDPRPMAAHFEIDKIDEMLSDWEFRGELARQAAMTLSNTRDKQIFSTLITASATIALANDPAPVSGLSSIMYNGGDQTGSTTVSRFTDLGNTASTDALRSDAALGLLRNIEEYIVFLQESNVPYRNLYCAISPQAFMDVRALGVARLGAELGDGGNQLMFNGSAVGGFATGLGAPYSNALGNIQDSLEYMGCKIIKSNHILTTDLSAGTTIGAERYNLDFAAGGTKGVMWTPEAVAAIRLQGMKVDSTRDIRRNTDFTVASMMGGTGVVRPECSAMLTSIDIGNASFNTRDELATLLDLHGAWGSSSGYGPHTSVA
jgi:hypothetical protein